MILTRIFQCRPFNKVFKKLHKNQQEEVEVAIKQIIKNPEPGVAKRCPTDESGVLHNYYHKY